MKELERRWILRMLPSPVMAIEADVGVRTARILESRGRIGGTNEPGNE
jgi:hypothetical protein